MLKRIPLYPLLISIFPILSLASFNIQEIFISAMVRPLLASLIFGMIVYGIAYLVTKDIHRAALISSVILLFFFAYGHGYDALEDITVSGIALFRHRTLVPVLGLIVLGMVFIFSKCNLHRFADLSLVHDWFVSHPSIDCQSYESKYNDYIRCSIG
jgi:hypothetical protein